MQFLFRQISHGMVSLSFIYSGDGYCWRYDPEAIVLVVIQWRIGCCGNFESTSARPVQEWAATTSILTFYQHSSGLNWFQQLVEHLVVFLRFWIENYLVTSTFFVFEFRINAFRCHLTLERTIEDRKQADQMSSSLRLLNVMRRLSVMLSSNGSSPRKTTVRKQICLLLL